LRLYKDEMRCKKVTYILTNYHVIDGVEDLKVSFADGSSYDAVLVGGEADNDIAVLKIEADGLLPVTVGNSRNMQVGEQVVAIGNPLGELTFTLTAGYISALDREITMSGGTAINVLQTDAAINSGNSGGPLFNLYGECIGIVNAKYSNNGSSDASIEGIGFAIPIHDVVDMVTDIMAHGYVTGKPFLGVTVEDVDAAARQRGIPAGVVLQAVAPGLAAGKGGLREGDILTSINGAALDSSDGLAEALEQYSAGETITFSVYRDGKSLSVKIKLDERNSETQKTLENYIVQKQAAEQQPSTQHIPTMPDSDFFPRNWLWEHFFPS